MAYTMADFKREFVKKYLPQLTPEERQEALRSLTPEERQEALRSLTPEELLGVLSAEQIREYLDRLSTGRPTKPHKPRRKN